MAKKIKEVITEIEVELKDINYDELIKKLEESKKKSDGEI